MGDILFCATSRLVCRDFFDDGNSVKVSVPTRLDLAGGPCDVPPFQNSLSTLVNASIDLRVEVIVRRRNDQQALIYGDSDRKELLSLPLSNRASTGDNALQKAVLDYLGYSQGVDVIVKSPIPKGSGLGGSAAVAVALLDALQYLSSGKRMPRLELANQAYQVEAITMGNLSGKQDQYCSALLGFLALEFENDHVKASKLDVHPEFVKCLEASSLLVFLPGEHVSGSQLEEMILRFEDPDDERARQAVSQIKLLGASMKDALTQENLKQIWEITNQMFAAQELLCDSMVTTEMRALRNTLLALGASAVKASGAGGGGAMLCFFPASLRTTIEAECFKRGLTVEAVRFVYYG